MLAEGQDPDALEARLAYHLHRLQITGQPLRNALKGKAFLATALSQARTSVDHNFIVELATCLNISADELLREPTSDEAREWSFYRTSAANRQDVWSKAVELAKTNNISLRELAKTLNIDFSDLRKAISGTRPRVLELEHAQRLASTTKPPIDPNELLAKFSDNKDSR